MIYQLQPKEKLRQVGQKDQTVAQLINALDDAYLKADVLQDREKCIYFMQALQSDIARHVQFHGGLPYDTKTEAAKAYSDATLGTASFLHKETPDINSLFKTTTYCEYCLQRGHDVTACRQKGNNATGTRDRKMTQATGPHPNALLNETIKWKQKSTETEITTATTATKNAQCVRRSSIRNQIVNFKLEHIMDPNN